MNISYLEAVVNDEISQRLRLLLDGVVPQLAEEDHAEREVVLAEPVGDLVVLDVGPRRHVDDEVAEVLPVADDVDGAGAHFRVGARDRNVGRE